MKLVGALIWGVILGVAAVFLHSAFVPFGLILALLGTGIGIWLIGRAWGLRRYKFLAAIGWALVTWRAGSLGVGGELLVQGNSVGNTLVFGGFVIVVLAAAVKA